MPLLDDEQQRDLSRRTPDWDVANNQMKRVFTFDDFVASMAFVTAVALLAEKADHHPDIDIRWNRVALTLSTHSQGGLTEKDVELAVQVDKLA